MPSAGHSTPSTIWEYVDSATLEVPISIVSTLAGDDGYQPDVVYDNLLPRLYVNLRAYGMSEAEKDAEKLKSLTRGATFTYTVDMDGQGATQTITGRPVAVNEERIENSPYYTVTIRLKRSDVLSLLAALQVGSP